MNNKPLDKKTKELQNQLHALKKEAQTLAEKRSKLEREFDYFESRINQIKPNHFKKMIRTTGAYILGKRNRKQLYSKSYKMKQASNDLKGYKRALYNEGFVELVLEDLENLYTKTNNKYLKQAIAWELALWFANMQTESGALQAISYVQEAKVGVRDNASLRKMSIIEAECYLAIGNSNIALEILQLELNKETHPDLYLAIANTVSDVSKKTTWINKMYEYYNLAHVKFNQEKIDYDELRMKDEVEKYSKGPKVSIILPAYHAEKGIQIAIESILGQSWENMELLIVDDCSPDNTLEMVHAYAKKDNRIKVFSTEKNSGPYVARNIALEAATGEFVTINDADDWSHTDKIRIQVEHLMKHPSVLGNTSEQVRLTEDGQFYRRGNPGKYIFSNMSSFMFRREPVMEKLGYWDSVRFAADGEFIRRFIKCFGNEALIHLKSGPLSFPRQSVSSLTSSSAFGYSGFFMGVRKEYVESFTAYHKAAKTLYYPPYQTERLFPVPEPMIPTYKKQVRHYDLIMMLDINDQSQSRINLLEKEFIELKKLNLVVGIVKKTIYNLSKKEDVELSQQVRNLIKEYELPVIVYGESVTCDILMIRSAKLMHNWQKYLPKIQTKSCLILIDELPKMTYDGDSKHAYNFRQSMHNIMIQYDKKGRWYPLNQSIREELTTIYAHDIRNIPLTPNNWTTEVNEIGKEYVSRLKSWILI